MNGMDAVIQIRNGAVKGISIYADKSRGCAARFPLRACPDAFHSTLKIRKREVMPVNQGFLCCANLFAAARRRPNCTASAARIERRRNPGTAKLTPDFLLLDPDCALPSFFTDVHNQPDDGQAPSWVVEWIKRSGAHQRKAKR
jgi:hypothetical protein